MRSPQEAGWYESVIRDRVERHGIEQNQGNGAPLFLLAAYAEAISKGRSVENVLDQDLIEAHDTAYSDNSFCLTGGDLLFFPHIAKEKRLQCCPRCRALLDVVTSH